MYTHAHKFGETALHFAVDQEHEDIVEVLLKAIADPDLTEVIIVTTTVLYIVQKIMPYDPLHNKFVQSESCINALGIVLDSISIAGDVVPVLCLPLVDDCVKILQVCQETALMLAARKGSLEIVKKLIHHGANANLTNEVNLIQKINKYASLTFDSILTLNNRT